MVKLETITILCDADGCLAMHEGTREAYRGHAMTAAFRSAQAEGWRVHLVDRAQHWLCPVHAIKAAAVIRPDQAPEVAA